MYVYVMANLQKDNDNHRRIVNCIAIKVVYNGYKTKRIMDTVTIGKSLVYLLVIKHGNGKSPVNLQIGNFHEFSIARFAYGRVLVYMFNKKDWAQPDIMNPIPPSSTGHFPTPSSLLRARLKSFR